MGWTSVFLFVLPDKKGCFLCIGGLRVGRDCRGSLYAEALCENIQHISFTLYLKTDTISKRGA